MKRLVALALCGILTSGQLGAQWVQTSLGDAQIGFNLFSDETGVWAATLNGVYYTTDAGEPWLSWGPSGRLVFDVITSGPYVLAATEGSGAGVYRTSDAGVNWLPSTGISDQSVRAFAKNSAFIFACTWGGGIFRSSDDGATWESLGLTNHGFRSMLSVGEEVFAAGDSIVHSIDNGMTWTKRALPYPAGDTRCLAYHNGKLYAGDFGLYLSEDTGNSWSLLYGVAFDSAGNASGGTMFRDLASYGQALIAAMSPGAIGLSQDDGVSWMGWEEGVMADWTFAALAIRSPYIWTIREFFGNAYRRPLSELVTGVRESTGEQPAEYGLSQNYPNPFNPSTTITYELPASSMVQLRVYDLLGHEISVLVNERREPGVHEVAFDASGLSSGMYLYRVTAGSFAQIRKMMLVR